MSDPSENATPEALMTRIDAVLSHVWMVRTFLKHCEEVEDDEELAEVHRGLYDFMLALGGPWKDQDPAAYFKQANKKLGKFRKTIELFVEIQPEVSAHMNFQMAKQSLLVAEREIVELLERAKQL
jgi:hypothetical protein